MPIEKMTIAALRVRAGYSQKEAAQLLKVSHTTLVRWESDSSDIAIGKMLEIADLYRYPFDNIYFGNTEELSKTIKCGGVK